MIRPKVRLSTLALLILIAALTCALIVQWQREARLRVESEFQVERARAEAKAARLEAAQAQALQVKYLRQLDAIRVGAGQAPPGP